MEMRAWIYRINKEVINKGIYVVCTAKIKSYIFTIRGHHLATYEFNIFVFEKVNNLYNKWEQNILLVIDFEPKWDYLEQDQYCTFLFFF